MSARTLAGLSRGLTWGLAALLPVAGAFAADDAPRRCAAIADDRERLACYDRWQPPQPAARAAEPTAPKPSAASAAATVSSDAAIGIDSNFGAETLARPKARLEGPDRIETRVLGTLNGWKQGQLFRLENGQVWRSIDDREYHHRAEHPAVTIERNFLGNYFMRFEGTNAHTRVRRVE